MLPFILTPDIEVLKIIPGARAIMVVPLWDYNKERWYAGGIIWTCTPTRVFTKEGELSYLRAFGTSVLAELARLEVQIYDKAKSDILGSLSHEIRSPLHGIIAAADLLHDTSLDAFQCDVLHSLESCGRVLLDVLNHLLDYSKVNAFVQVDKTFKGARKSIVSASPNQHPLRFNRSSLSTYTHLDSLLEETIDSVFAGHNFQKLSIAQLDHKSNRSADAIALQIADTIDAVESFGYRTWSSGQLDIQLGDVYVFVDIDPSIYWGVYSQPGALRRVILNLFGNSLQFTDKGLILVTLRLEKNRSKKTSHSTDIKLTITDTGRGISAHFMQHHLFKPFTQEDRLSPGTGLGLSLVKRIIKTLEGSVTVDSQVGVGTCVRVTVPVPEATNEKRSESNFEELKDALAGLRVFFVGLNEGTQKLVGGKQSISEFDLMHKLCSEWLKLQVVKLNDEFRPDLVLCGESGMSELLNDTGRRHLSAPIIVICKDAVAAYQHNKSFHDMRAHRILQFISQPVGPRKLAKSFDAAFSRWTKAAEAEIPGSISEITTPHLHPSMIPFSVNSFFTESGFSNSTNEHEPTMKVALHREVTPEEYKPQEAALLEDKQQDLAQSVHKTDDPQTAIGETGDYKQAPAQTIQEQEILLVDDNKINLRILMSYMKRLKRRYKTATNGLEALETFAASPSSFSCILMDLSMPVMDGLESTRKIRELERTRKPQSHTKIIALTGLASSRSRQGAFASGIDLYLTKPVRLKELAGFLITGRDDV